MSRIKSKNIQKKTENKHNIKQEPISNLLTKSAQILREVNQDISHTQKESQQNLKNLNLTKKMNLKKDSKNKNQRDVLSLKDEDCNRILPINYKPKNQFQDFKVKKIVHKLGHEHAEVDIYLPCSVNFENRPALHFFEDLFLKYGGILYDRLRDDLGWIYSLRASFENSLQVCNIYLTCEIDLVVKIIKETEAVFNDWDKYFRLQKFQELTKTIAKKMDLSQDVLGASNRFMSNTFRSYGIPENYEEYRQRLEKVQVEDIKKIYTEIQKNLPLKKVVIVSKNLAIEKIEI